MSDAETYYQALISEVTLKKKLRRILKFISDFRESSSSGGIITTSGDSNNDKQNKSSNHSFYQYFQ